jgi:nucleoid-associated protein YgaU
LAVALTVLGLAVVIASPVRALLAGGGSVPASAVTIRPARPAAVTDLAAPAPIAATGAPEAATTRSADGGRDYIVQPGDSLWSLAQRFHGAVGMSSYVEALVAANGGATVQPGQLLNLP